MKEPKRHPKLTKTTNNIARFRAGARRRDRKSRFDLIPFEFLESVAGALTSGAVKYGPYNWKRGRKDFFLDAWNHAFVHLLKFKEGDASEDHLAHLACNVAFLIWAIRNGVVAQDDFSRPG
jgi:Domain of unknown function (DUF5664)